jgi:EAL domain-containing protein (putative c-di-GMP-specific phosphodiesterase class I)
VRGVIGLADAFHKHTVAEGVETWEHAAKLKSLNCQIIQGYAIARPMPAEQFPAWLQQFSMPDL